MNLQQHYDTLYKESINKIKNGNYQIDRQIDSTTDNRFGITLLIRPPQEIKNAINKFIQDIRHIEPNQYYYPESDMHITVMSIISCYQGFKLSQIHTSNYINLIQNCLLDIAPFSIQFKGLTASPSCIMVKGFFIDNALNQIRNNLRNIFKDSDLQHSIDKRYSIQAAHSTILRLRENLINKNRFLSLIDKYKDYEFGSFTVKSIELVANDWYQKKEKVQKLHKFILEETEIINPNK